MARVVVIGGGFGGLASALRLAKLGHERHPGRASAELGGALVAGHRRRLRVGRRSRHTLLPGGGPRPVPQDRTPAGAGAGARAARLPARALVRGRHRARPRRGGSRAAQLAAFDALGPGLGERWVDHVDSYADDWEVLRRQYLEVPWDPGPRSPRELAARLDSRESLRKRLRQASRDERLRLVGGPPVRGRRPRPARRARLGRADGVPRAAVRRVGVRRRDGRARSRRWSAGSTRGRSTVVRAEPATSWCATAARSPSPPPRASSTPTSSSAPSTRVGCPRWRRTCERTTPAIPPVVCHLGLAGEVRDLPHELVVHGDPTLVAAHAAAGHPRDTTRGRCTAAAARRGPAGRARAARARRPRAGGHPRRPLARATWSSGGAARRSACCGRAAAPSAAGSARARRSTGVYAAGAHATPGSRAAVRRAVRRAGRPGGRSGLAQRSWKVTVTDASHRVSPARGRRRPRAPWRRAADRSSARAAALDDRPATSPSSGAGQRRRGGPPRSTASAYAASRAAASAARRSVTSSETPSTWSRSPTASARAVSRAPAASMSGQRDASASDAPRSRRVAPSVVVGGPDLERRRADALRRRVLAAVATICCGRAVGAGERLGDARRSVDRRARGRRRRRGPRGPRPGR